MNNKSFRISDKSLHIALVVGSCLLAATILALTIAVGVSHRREKNVPVTTDPVQTLPPATTDDASSTGTKPTTPTIDTMTFVLPVEGALLQVHDLQTLAYSVTMQDYRVHSGIDIETEAGAAVNACASGTVSKIYADALMGNCIVIDHGNGVESVYRNLDDTLPEGLAVGSSVKAGQLIGAVGESAIIEIGDRPHLHFELMNNGSQVNPAEYLDYQLVSEQVED